MTDDKNPAFAAIITIASPENDELARLRVMLLPADLVPLDNGIAKPLQDCTLAELQQFAESLEKRLWERHGSATLIDLVVNGQAEITFSFADGQATESQTMDLWLAHAIVFPDEKTAVPAVSHQAEGAQTDPDQPVDLLPTLETEADTQELVQEFAEDVELSPIPESGEASGVGQDELQPESVDGAAVNGIESSERITGMVEKEEESGPVKEDSEKLAVSLQSPGTQVTDIRVLGLRRPLNHTTWTAVDILANETAFRDAQAHSLTSMDKEVAGVLVGPQPEKQPDGRYLVHVADIIIAKHTRMHGASVTYTPESWRYLNDKLAERYPDESAVIVGWYHTHPGFGIFLSGMDLFIHQNFFTQKWHIALVLDPRARRSGFFCWDRQMTKVDAYDFPWPIWASGSW